MNATLWCVHVYGPDDLLACASRQDAVQNALWLNLSGYKQQNTNDELMPVAWAIPEPWPGTPEAHHEALADQECQDERWTDAEVKLRLLAGELFDFTEDGRPIDWHATVADAENRGAVKALQRLAEEIDEHKQYGGIDLVIWVTGICNSLASGQVAL
jgi:hypothetical protein